MSLISEALTKYPFRAQRAHESDDVYRVAVADHLVKYDWAVAEEVRIGKAQVDWTAADVAEFQRRVNALPPASQEFPPGLHAFEVIEDAGPYPVTEASLRDLSDRLLAFLMTMRREHPTKPIPILASVLLTTGTVLTTLPNSSNRIMALKALVRAAPAFGFCLVFDGWIHGIDVEKGVATKVDAIVEHVGTRDLRLIKHRPYRVVAGQPVVFTEPPPADINSRDAGLSLEDPYAEIFVSVPPTIGDPS